MSRLRSRGWGPFRQEWYSVCSGHFYYDAQCPRCCVGRWINVWRQMFGHTVYTIWPELWRRWANRPAGKKELAKLLAEIRGDKDGT